MAPKAEVKKILTGKEKAALVMMTLGIDDAAEVTRHMNKLDVRELATIASRMGDLTEDDVAAVLGEFHSKIDGGKWMTNVGNDFSWDVIRGTSQDEQFHSLDFLQRADKSQLLEIIKHEHPQVVSFVMSYIPADQAAGILSMLTPRQQSDIAFRISNMETPNRNALKHLDRMLGEKLDFLAASGAIEVGGIDSLVKIIRGAGRKTEKSILEELRETHPDLGEQIKNMMFVFEDIINLDNLSIQKLLKNVDMKILVLALKKTDPAIRDLILNNLSERAKTMLQDEMQFLGKIPMREVEAAQQEVAEAIRRMEEAGEISVRKEDEVYV